MVRLFEMTQAGLLVEVEPAQAEAVRAASPYRRVVNAEYDVLLTAEEVTAQAVEAQQAAEAAATAATEQAAAEQRKQAALTKLEALGLTADDLREVLG